MGYIIGDSVFSTWGRIRGAVIQNSIPSRYSHNEVYPDTIMAFKTIEGNGLLKRGNITLFPADLTMRIDATDFYLEAKNFDERYHPVLIGEDVTNDSTEVYTITADAFVPPDYQTLSPMPTTYTIVNIGLFDLIE
jgi:hypothetical protein